jgi:hypothetical protein
MNTYFLYLQSFGKSLLLVFYEKTPVDKKRTRTYAYPTQNPRQGGGVWSLQDLEGGVAPGFPTS